MIQGSRITNKLRNRNFTVRNRYSSYSSISNPQLQQKAQQKQKPSQQNSIINEYPDLPLSQQKNNEQIKVINKIKRDKKQIYQVDQDKFQELDQGWKNKKIINNHHGIPFLSNNNCQQHQNIHGMNFVQLYKINLQRAILNTTKLMIKKNKMRYNMHSMQAPYNICIDESSIKKSFKKTKSNYKYSKNIQPIHHIYKIIHQMDSLTKTPTPSSKPVLTRPLNQQLGITKFSLHNRINAENIKKLSNILIALKMKEYEQNKKQNKKYNQIKSSISTRNNYHQTDKYQIKPWESGTDLLVQ